MLDDRAALARSRRRLDVVAAQWRDGAGYRALAAAFDAVDPADIEAASVAAESWLSDTSWTGTLLAPLIAALTADPLFEPPLKIARDPLRTSAVLYDGPAVSVVATVLSADVLASLPPPTTIALSGRLSFVRYVRAGGARLRCWHAPANGSDLDAAHVGAAVERPAIMLQDGMMLRLDGRDHGYLLDGPAADVVTLTVSLRTGGACYAREHAIADGTLVRAAALSEDGSRTRMLLTLLRLSGRRDVPHVFAEASRDGAFYLRWAAMREWLALDVAAALPRLTEMAGADPNEEVRRAATATLAMIEERVACPA